jgi:hypothetical protein
MTAPGPTLPTWALRQVVGYLRYTGHDASVVAKAALDPKPNIRGAAIRSPTAMTSSTAVVTFQTRHAEPGHGFSGSFFVQRATAPFQIVGIISLRIAESWRPHSRSMFRTEGCYPSSGRPRIQCGRRAFVRHRLIDKYGYSASSGKRAMHRGSPRKSVQHSWDSSSIGSEKMWVIVIAIGV